MAMQGFENEVTDVVSSSPEHNVGTVSVTPIVIQRTDNKDCTCVHIHNPVLGSRSNDYDDVIYVTVDGSDPGTYGETIIIGCSVTFSGNIIDGNVKIVSNNSGTNYEIVLVG